MIKRLPALFYLLLFIPVMSQTPRTAVVEHFTNSVCSICASKNPAFFQTLSAYPQVLHISFYPSAPYNYCFFSVQNKQENDDRTKYYGAFGATPRAAVNGQLLPLSGSILNNTTLDTVISKTSPVEVKAYERLMSADSVAVTIVVRTTEVNSFTNVRLFAGVAESPINRTTQNGETVHYNVFRKALTHITGDSIMLPALNDSIVLQFAYKAKSDWTVNNLYTLAMVQVAGTKEMLNAAKSERVSIPTGISNVKADKISLFPNPVADKLFISDVEVNNPMNYSIFDLTGRRIQDGKLLSAEIDVAGLVPGIYFLKARNSTLKFIKQ